MNNWNDIFKKLKNEDFNRKFIKEILKKEGAEEALYNELKEALESYDKDEMTNVEHVLEMVLLLGELESERSLPLFLKILTYDEDSIDVILGDLLFEVFPYALLKIGKNHLKELFDFVKRDEISVWNRDCVLLVINRMLLSNPEIREFVIINMKECFKLKKMQLFLIPYVFEFHLTELEKIALKTFKTRKFDPILLSKKELVYSEEIPFFYSNLEEIYDFLYKLKEDREEYMNSLKEEESIKGYGLYDGIENNLPFDIFSDDDFDLPQPRKNNKIGRNDPCPCGSGKKYKKCCGKNK